MTFKKIKLDFGMATRMIKPTPVGNQEQNNLKDY